MNWRIYIIIISGILIIFAFIVLGTGTYFILNKQDIEPLQQDIESLQNKLENLILQLNQNKNALDSIQSPKDIQKNIQNACISDSECQPGYICIRFIERNTNRYGGVRGTPENPGECVKE